MHDAGFEARVRALRETWRERRETTGLFGDRHFDSRCELLLVLHSWAEQACRTIEDVYGPNVASTSGPPDWLAQPPAFSISVFRLYTARFFLKELATQTSLGWTISAEVRTPGARMHVGSVGPDRRLGAWSRSRIEEILLSMLSEHEREQSTIVDAETERLQTAPRRAS
jgi:hypothetical protein